jgi:transposase-like protein
MRKGRPAKGPKLAETLDGSEPAKRKLRIILETVTGERTVEEACDALGIGAAAFHKLRSRTFQDAVQSLEPRPVGRPRKEDPQEADEIEALKAEIWQLKFDLQAARIREEIAVTMPHLLKDKKPAEAKGSKKKGRKKKPRGKG